MLYLLLNLIDELKLCTFILFNYNYESTAVWIRVMNDICNLFHYVAQLHHRIYMFMSQAVA